MRQPVDADRLRAFMKALAREARRPLQVYLVGGSTAVLEGWREGSTSSGEPTIRRRAAVVLDRSRVIPDRSGMRRLHVPAE